MRIAWALPGVLSACVINPSQGIEATWTIERLEQGEVGCPADWQTATLVAIETADPARRTVARFDCADGTGVAELAPGAYTTHLELLDGSDRVIATSLPQQLEVKSMLTAEVESTIYVDAGYVSLSWSWSNERWCGDGYNPFQQIYLSLNGPQGGTHLFSCHDDGAITSPLVPGTYTASIGQGVASNQALPGFVVEAPNKVTVLPPITF